jgi:acetyltransferase-like isoleucine patch superfamily enzyme
MSLADVPGRMLRRGLAQLGVALLRVQGQIAKKSLPRFANDPQHLTIELPRRLINPQFMTWGDHVWIGPGAFIAAVTRYPALSLAHPDKSRPTQTFSPSIAIGQRVSSSGNLVIGAAEQVAIGDDVMFACNVTVLDNSHGFDHPYEPYKYQPLGRIAPVRVGRGCWIGQNVVILPGVEIGEMCIVGANSVVTESLPDRVIAVGAPARVVKTWDEDLQSWVSCLPGAAGNGRSQGRAGAQLKSKTQN